MTNKEAIQILTNKISFAYGELSAIHESEEEKREAILTDIGAMEMAISALQKKEQVKDFDKTRTTSIVLLEGEEK